MAYEKPEMKMIGFDVEDVITSSSVTTTTIEVVSSGSEDRDYL